MIHRYFDHSHSSLSLLSLYPRNLFGWLLPSSLVSALALCGLLPTCAQTPIDESTVQQTLNISDAQVRELTQHGDRLADQGDYQAALEKYTRAYQGVVSRLRGQAFVRAVEPTIFNREQLGKEMLTLIEQEYTPEELALMDQSYKVFGLVPLDIDCTALMTSMLTEEVAGFYDPDNKRMVLIVEDGPAEQPNWLGRLLGAEVAFDKEEQKTTLAHELTHALQDQLYDLNAMEHGIEQDDDMLLAFSALVEGDATLLMFLETSEEKDIRKMDPVAMRATFNLISWMMPLAGGKTFRSAPAIFRDSLTFPYFQGMLFVLAIAGEGGWASVHQAYANPPRSTEQILHPDKYLHEVDLPQQVTLMEVDDILPASWTKLGGNCLGELQTSILLKRVIGGSSAAAGWDGDYYEVFRDADGKLAMVYASVWDSPRDADEFAKAYRSYRDLPTLRRPQSATVSNSVTDSIESLDNSNSDEHPPAPRLQHDEPSETAESSTTDDLLLEAARVSSATDLQSVFAEDAEQMIVVEGDKVWIVEGFAPPNASQLVDRLRSTRFEEKQFVLPTR